jgi:hypothetical protein
MNHDKPIVMTQVCKRQYADAVTRVISMFSFDERYFAHPAVHPPFATHVQFIQFEKTTGLKGLMGDLSTLVHYATPARGILGFTGPRAERKTQEPKGGGGVMT